MSTDVAGPDGSVLSEWLGPNAQAVERWYCVSREGMATLCVDEEDAQANAKHCDQAWPAGGPHRAVQLVDAAADPVARHLAAGVADHWRDECMRLRVALTEERKHWRGLAERVAHQGNARGLEGLAVRCTISKTGAVVSWEVDRGPNVF